MAPGAMTLPRSVDAAFCSFGLVSDRLALSLALFKSASAAILGSQ